MSKITSRGKGSVGCGFTKSAAKFTRCQSTRRPGKPSTTGFLPPILDLILLLPFSQRLEKTRKYLSCAIWTARAFGSSCRPEHAPADSRNEYVVIPSVLLG